MNAANQKFETIGFLRGGRISGFLDRQRTPFSLAPAPSAGAQIVGADQWDGRPHP